MTAEPIPYDVVEPSDGMLAYDHLCGADQAFAELYRRYYPRLVRLCARRTGDIHLAEDVAQETLVRALRYLGGFDTSRPMWPWLKTIATRIAYQNAQKSALERCSDLGHDDAGSVDSPTHRVDDQLVLNAALDRVPARQRAALLMRYVDDWSTADSARFAGMSVSAFEQLLFRARRRLGTEYRRLTDSHRFGAVAVVAAALRRARAAIRTRAEGLGVASNAAGAGLMGLASIGFTVAVLVGPPTTVSPGMRSLPETRPAPVHTGVVERFLAVERAAATASGPVGTASAPGYRPAAPGGGGSDDRISTEQHVGPGGVRGSVPHAPLGEGQNAEGSVHMSTPLGPAGAGIGADRGTESLVECDEHLDCAVSPPPVP